MFLSLSSYHTEPHDYEYLVIDVVLTMHISADSKLIVIAIPLLIGVANHEQNISHICSIPRY
jgi:hypothetical protein